MCISRPIESFLSESEQLKDYIISVKRSDWDIDYGNP